MALDKTPTLILNNVTISSGASSNASSGVDLSEAVDFGIGYQLTFNGSVSSGIVGAQIELYADPSGTAVEFAVGSYADPCDSGDVMSDPGHQVQGFIPMNRAAKYVKAKVKNTSGYSITACSLWAQVQTQ